MVEPGFVDFQVRIGQQAVAVETLDVVALEGTSIAPDVDLILLHGGNQHGARYRAPQRRGVEVGHSGSGDVERAALQRGDALCRQLAAAVDQARAFGAILHGLARYLVVVGLVRLAQIRGVGVGHRALVAHPVQRGAGVQAARERNADLLSYGQVLENTSHVALSCVQP